MRVSLVSITEPLVAVPAESEGVKRYLNPEELIVFTARVSSPQNQGNLDTAPRLLRYLIAHGHWSPLEMVDMTVEIETSRAIAAQILRHRSFSFQEFSQRYAAVDAGCEVFKARRQDAKNRQASHDDLPDEDVVWFTKAQLDVWDKAYDVYAEALLRGIAKEQARMVLPLGTLTRLYMKGSVRSWIHYLQARTAVETQKEHRDVAEAVRVLFVERFPNVAEALEMK